MTPVLFSILGATGFMGLVALLIWFLVEQSKKVGEDEQIAAQSKSDLDGVTKANNAADAVDGWSDATVLQYLKNHGVRTSSDNPRID